jgi:hypothetical protein
MLLLRGLGASLLWIVAGLLGLLGVLLSATLILLPVGIPLLMLAKKVFGYSMVVLMPNRVRHPVQHAEKTAKGRLKRTGKQVKSAKNTAKKRSRKARGALR